MEVNRVLNLKECPRCHGDVHTNRDMYGTYKECLQCGYMLDLERPNGLIPISVPRAKKKVA
jgi:hypothetical protein|tara:strand:+ start:430 stop:612 length:183 start_codon:yes stop_codon:yes gene_type:complete